MNRKVVIVEDESMIAYDLELTLSRAGYIVAGTADSYSEALSMVRLENPDIVLVDIFLKGSLTGIDLGEKLSGFHVPFIYLSANFQESVLEKARSTFPYGFLVKPFREEELLAMMDVILYRHQNGNEIRFRQEKELESILLHLLNEEGEWISKVEKIASSIQPYVPFDVLAIRPDHQTEFLANGLMLIRSGFNKYKVVQEKEFHELTGLTNADVANQLRNHIVEPGIFNDHDFDKLAARCRVRSILSTLFDLRSSLHLPIFTARGSIIHLLFFSRKSEGYTIEHQKLLSLVNQPLSTLTEQMILAIPEAERAKAAQISDAAQKGSGSGYFNGIIGNSHKILEVFDHISIVAPLDASVLILGESGTGKEMIARSIHELSPRRNQPLIIINCASVPGNLIESELFGHEKGAFTGALERRKGKFEAADKGTIFLDEIGEMPIDMQVKLLRVLQEREFERLGGNHLIKVDVRIIAATNRDLEKAVREGKFRLDLYYRLCVYPILVPALRDRKGDLLLLTNYFMEKFNRKFGKQITEISPAAWRQLESHSWPGNVRELENCIERSILRTRGNILEDISIFFIGNEEKDKPVQQQKTEQSIEDAMRDHIIAVLKKCKGKISGPGGAAEYLKMPATTLHSRVKKLGLKKYTFSDGG
ncbi:MAG TPA: sigma 54-interacting transcriptional regulator [Puia sp.]|jgi:transcriptional regulator with GAF, ATPase, and Fis domain